MVVLRRVGQDSSPNTDRGHRGFRSFHCYLEAFLVVCLNEPRVCVCVCAYIVCIEKDRMVDVTKRIKSLENRLTSTSVSDISLGNCWKPWNNSMQHPSPSNPRAACLCLHILDGW